MFYDMLLFELTFAVMRIEMSGFMVGGASCGLVAGVFALDLIV